MSGSPLLFLPGAAGAGAFWAPILERLPRAWPVEALDLPGLGSIPARADVASYGDLVEYVARRMIAPTTLVAQSMGAYIAIELASRYPSAVTGLVLAAATGGVAAERHGAIEWRDEYREAFPDAEAWARASVPDLTARLPEINTPVLLLWATADALSPISVAHALRARVPAARLITFASDSHWFVRDFSDEVAAAIRSFVARTR
jgi:2-hydroxy-6-oxonona-2,4-dienedioate hydrolase